MIQDLDKLFEEWWSEPEDDKAEKSYPLTNEAIQDFTKNIARKAFKAGYKKSSFLSILR